MTSYHWEVRVKTVIDNRLAWFAEPADEDFWSGYWEAHVNADYFKNARQLALERSQLGRILLDHMATSGKHLEAGCGPGYWVAALEKKFDVIGIEYSQPVVELVNRTDPDVCVQYGDALALDFPEETFDSYLSFGVVEHRFDGPEPFLTEAYRVLKPDGKLIISVPAFGPVRRLKHWFGMYESEIPSKEFFQYGFTKNEFVKILDSTGFSVGTATYIDIDRMLLEEVGIYKAFRNIRGSKYLKIIVQFLMGDLDGHMLVVVAQKA